MKLSILDQSPIMAGTNSEEALQASLKLAQLGEQYDYTRFWLTEHHDIEGIASSAPEVLLAYIGGQTSKIRLGSGAILLPHYKPFKVAELFHTLASLFPGRIDLGIGRAPGGSAEVTMALNDNFMQKVYEMPERLTELLHLLHQNFPDEHPFSKIKPLPLPKIPPEPWLLGTSVKSAKLAAEKGMAYAFGQFMSDEDGKSIVTTYLNEFKPKGSIHKPKALIAVNVVCSETTEEARDIVSRNALWQILRGSGRKVPFPTHEEFVKYSFNEKERGVLNKIQEKTIFGHPQKVLSDLNQLVKRMSVSEMMISTVASSFEERLKSYQLIGQAYKNQTN